MLTLRVRTQVGTYRLNDVAPTDTFADLKVRLQREHKANVTAKGFALDSKGAPLADTATISSANLTNGHMLFAEVDANTRMESSATSSSSAGTKTVIVDGNIAVVADVRDWTSDLLGGKLLTKSGVTKASTALRGKRNVGLYFSAHWCGPCRNFTPALVEFYEQLKGEDANALEIIFVSSDRDASSFGEYYGEMPWMAIPFDDRSKAAELGELFQVRGIPSLIILDGTTGKMIDKDGRATVANARGVSSRALSKWK